MKTIALILILATASPAFAQQPTDRAAAIAQAKAALALLEAIPEPAPLPSTPAPIVGDLSAVYGQLAILNGKIDALTVAVESGRAENRTFYDAVRTEWKGILGKVALYGLPMVGALFAGRATK